MDVLDLAFGVLLLALAVFAWRLGDSRTARKDEETVYQREERKTLRIQFRIMAALALRLGALRIVQAFFG